MFNNHSDDGRNTNYGLEKIMAEDTIIIDNVEFSADKKILLDFFAETTEYTIPDGVTTISEYAFESNELLKK